MQPPSAVTTTIRLLGDLSVRYRGTEVRPRGRKARAILGVVAVSPSQCVRRDELVDLLWSDRGEEQARSSLRQALVEIKNMPLGADDAIAIDRDLVRIVGGCISTDITDILCACDAQDVAMLATRLERAAGAFMAGYDGVAAGLGDWLRFERPRQHERIIAAVLEQEPLIVAHARSADAHAILRGLERLDPHNELVARLGMRADYAAGDGASLHRRYRVLCEELEDEFGSKPAKETRALFDQLTVEPSLQAADLPTFTGELDGGRQHRTPPVVLVNPITFAGDDADGAHIAGAATDDIRIALARHSDVRVISLETLDLARIENACSSALSAYVLSGKLRLTPEGAKVNLQLGNRLEHRRLVGTARSRTRQDRGIDRTDCRESGRGHHPRDRPRPWR